MGIKNYGVIRSLDELRERVDQIEGGVFAYDIETGYDGPNREKAAVYPETAFIVGISFTNSTDWARYVPLRHDTGENLDNVEVAKLFWDLLNTGFGVAHNHGFELRHMAKWFRTYLSDDPERGDAVRSSRGFYPIRSDTQVEAYLIAEHEKLRLKGLTKELFGHQMTELIELFPGLPKNQESSLRFNVLELEPRVIEYACEDSVWCLAIHEKFYPQLTDRLLYRVEKAIVQDVLPPMEDEGICYDWAFMQRTADRLRSFRDRFNAEIMAELSELLDEPIAINLASHVQVRKILYDRLGLRTSVYTKASRDMTPEERVMSTGDIALRKLADKVPTVKKILQWREMTKLLGSYLDKYETKFNFAEDGRVHPSHLSAFVVTGRFACSAPNYQQSPKKYHFDLAEAKAAHEAGEEPPSGTCFKFNFRDVIMAPPDHYILGFDLSQAELRAIAGEAQETALLEAFAKGEDVHRVTASLMLGIPLDEVTDSQRDVGKTINFALLYGMSTKGLGDRLAIPTEEAQSLMDKYFAGLPAIAAYMAKQVEFGQRNGFVVSKFGRKLPIWAYKSEKRWIRQGGDRQCVNFPIQGAATGDYMKIAMINATKALKKAGLDDRVKLVMNIHDALEFYVHRDVEAQAVIAVLKPAVIFPVPGWPEMKADWHVAKRWGSPWKVQVNDDGGLTVLGEQVYELRPTVEVGDDGEEIEVLPEVDIEVLREVARSQSGRHVLLTLHEMPSADNWRSFRAQLEAMPGDNKVTVITPQGDVELPFTCSLRPDHLSMAAQLLGDAGVSIRYVAEHVESLAAGLNL